MQDLFGHDVSAAVQLDRSIVEAGISACLHGITSEQLVSMMYSKLASKVSTYGLIINIGSRRYPMRSELIRAFPHAREIGTFGLSGKGGLGKEDNDGETFFIVESEA